MRDCQDKMDEIQNIRHDVATDLLRCVVSESKAKSKIIVLLIIAWLVTIAGFVWYLQLPVEETVYVENDGGNTSYIGKDMNGDFNYGEDTGN